MGVLPDWMIERDVKIEPFSPQQHRPGVVSYGCTSYGYDVRVGYRWKVFDVLAGGVIDPKSFDPKLLREIDRTPRTYDRHDWEPNSVDKSLPWKCSRCAEEILDHSLSRTTCNVTPSNFIIIPPNSYALGESFETFTIPRDVVCVCVGKSTYARCFSGNTKVMLANGKSPTFRQMADKDHVRRWGFGVDPKTGQYLMTELKKPRWIGRENLVRITLDNGKEIDCTPDHEFLRHGGFYTQAQDLKPGDGLVPLYNKRFRERRMIYIPRVGNWLPAHWLADQWNVRHGVYQPIAKTHRHHKDEDKSNDNPTNIERKSIADHVRDHNKVYYGEGFDRELHSLLVREALAERMQDPEWYEAFCEMNRQKAEKFWTEEQYEKARQLRNEAIRATWNGDSKRKEEAAERMREVSKRFGFEDRSARWTPERRKQQAEVMQRLNAKMGKGNHTIVSVKKLKGLHDVFCLSSSDTGNFALENGVLVKNCGIIVNVTPGEPEWTGKWTIEVSNSSPLPAKVYCGEGIMQCIFIRSDGYNEQDRRSIKELAERAGGNNADYDNWLMRTGTCRTSYADKKGKYQSQDGLTLAKVEDK